MKRYPRRVSVKKGTLKAICSGLKTALVRIDDRIFANFRTGNLIIINSGDRTCTCEITGIRRYETLKLVLASEDLFQIAHGSQEEAYEYLNSIYGDIPPENRHFVVLQLKLVKVGRKPC